MLIAQKAEMKSRLGPPINCTKKSATVTNRKGASFLRKSTTEGAFHRASSSTVGPSGSPSATVGDQEGAACG